ncbi:hypothetical protein BDV06DRAFT_218623 [Aspergillus oleicola]
MKFLALLLPSLMSLAMADTIPSLDLKDINDVQTLDWLKATSGIDPSTVLGSRDLEDRDLGRCGMDSQCKKDEICARFFCVTDHPSLYPDTYCHTNKDCKQKGGRCVLHICAPPLDAVPPKDENNGIHCSGNGKTCIDESYTIEADDVGNPVCKSSKDCGKDSKCLAGICLAAARTARRDRLDRRVTVSLADKLEARQLVCHEDSECKEPGQPGGYCYNGICIA